MRKSVLLFGLILCLILVSGFTGREFPYRSYDAGNFYYQSRPLTAGTGMSGVPLSDKVVLLHANETFLGRDTEHQLMPFLFGTGSFFDWVSCKIKYEVIVSDLTDNNQLNLIAMAPRA